MVYIFSVFIIITLSTVALTFVFGRKGIRENSMLIAAGVSSFILSMAAPLIFTAFLSAGGEKAYYGPVHDLIWYIATALAAYIVIALFASALASQLITSEGFAAAAANIKNSAICRIWRSRFTMPAAVFGLVKSSGADVEQVTESIISEKFVDTGRIIDKMGVEKTGKQQNIQKTEQNMEDPEASLRSEYLDVLFPVSKDQHDASSGEPDIGHVTTVETTAAETTVAETTGIEAIIIETGAVETTIAEAEITEAGVIETTDVEAEIAKTTVTEAEITETGAAETTVTEAEIAETETADVMNAEDYIGKAFALKESRDFEGAILNYMYALDKGPARQDVFWIILDICVLYKDLGQAQLAREILQAYSETYSDVMDGTVKHEIEKNLILQ